MKTSIFILNFIIISQLYSVNCGILDWFRSKPKWISKIDKYPLVEAFHPHGIRVSIGDIEGLEMFGFHGKLNHCFSRGENGSFFGYAIEPNNGRWAFIDEHQHLKVGDALHYWIHVRLHGEEYKFSKDVRIINNLIPKPQNLFAYDANVPTAVAPAHSSSHHQGREMCPCDQVQGFSSYAATSSMFPSSVAPKPSTNNVLSEDLACKSQVDSLTEVLLGMLKGQILNSNLILTGQLANSGNAVLDVSKLFSVMELFDLIGKIKFASYTDCGIYFEMSSIVDKKRILVRAATDLQNSNNKFVEPEQTKCGNVVDNNLDGTDNDFDVRIKNDGATA